MDTPVIRDAGLHDFISVSFIDLRYAPAQKIIPQMPEV